MPGFERVARTVTLLFDVTGAEEMRDVQGAVFMPETVELRYGRFGAAWRLNRIEVGGADLSRNYLRVVRHAQGDLAVPKWVWDFVATIDVAEEVKG